MRYVDEKESFSLCGLHRLCKVGEYSADEAIRETLDTLGIVYHVDLHGDLFIDNKHIINKRFKEDALITDGRRIIINADDYREMMKAQRFVNTLIYNLTRYCKHPEFMKWIDDTEDDAE